MRDTRTDLSATPDFQLPNHLSCRKFSKVDRTWQRGRLVLLTALIALILLRPSSVAIVLSALAAAYFAAVLALRLVCIFVGAALPIFTRRGTSPNSDGKDLPIYSILVPLYREADMIEQLVGAVLRLDWPHDRLDVQLLIEADDRETLAAADRLNLQAPIRVTRVSGSGPRTKPNALNIGLSHARGAFVCVYDAEDRPHPKQLQVAYSTFRSAPETLAVLQAPLIGTPYRRSWIGRQWSLEYSVHFGLLIPAYAKLRIPIPLGGTSNHFRTDLLRRIGGWDAWNVTEDADIGLRYARFGWEVGTIWPPTYEDPPTALSVWLAQRVRWLKGFLITWSVLMRPPRKLIRELGLWRCIAMWLTFGAAVFSPFIYVPTMLWVTVALWMDQYQIGMIGAAILLSGLSTSLLADLLAPGPFDRARLATAVTRFLYWPLIGLSGIGALIGLIRRPTYWAKTPHQPSLKDQANQDDRLGFEPHFAGAELDRRRDRTPQDRNRPR